VFESIVLPKYSTSPALVRSIKTAAHVDGGARLANGKFDSGRAPNVISGTEHALFSFIGNTVQKAGFFFVQFSKRQFAVAHGARVIILGTHFTLLTLYQLSI
jgi:hypothetical protein